MSGVHKYPTISFRISPRERDEIEAKIKASGMQKKDYFVRSCIYIVNLAEEKGISKRTLENAKKELGIKGKRIGESWYWKLDEIVKP